MKVKKDFSFLYLTQEQVVNTGFDIGSFMEILEEHFRLYAQGKVILPTKVVLDLGERERGRINALTAYVGGDIDVCGIKWVASFPHNPQKYRIPRANAFIILNDSHTGAPLAVMDGTYVSAMRTGAVTGIGVKYLARRDSLTCAVIGCGVQARTQLMAIQAALPTLEEVLCYDINRGVSKTYAEEMGHKTGLKIEATDSVKAAVSDADITVTVTVADEPIVKDEFVKRGSLVVHVGSYQEEEEQVVHNSDKIVVDEWESVYHRKTPILARMYIEGKLKESDIHANLGEIVNGEKPGRENNEERIFFLPIGMGSEDVIAAYKIFRLAEERGIGQRLQLWEQFAIER
jgi:ornithine cyclodeaminase